MVFSKTKISLLLKICLFLIVFSFGFLFFQNQAQAQPYTITYDSTAFTVDSLDIIVEWNALGGGHGYMPWFEVNGIIKQYDYNSPPALGSYDKKCQTSSFSTTLGPGQNILQMHSNHYGCDGCGYYCDGVWAKITFANGQTFYTDTNWEVICRGVWVPGGNPDCVFTVPPCSPVVYIKNRTCGDCCSTDVRKIVTVAEVVPIPTIDLKADGSDGPITIVYNTSAELTWTSTDADSCTASGDWSGSKSTSGSQSTGNLTSSQTYTLTCDGPGGSDNDSVTVNVSGGTLFVSLTAIPDSGIVPLNNVDLTANVSGSAVGTINYTFYCNRSDSGTNITPGWAAKYNGTNDNPKTAVDVCDYDSDGTYTAKVIVERDTYSAEDRTNVVVDLPANSSPTAVSLSTNVSTINYCSQSPAYAIFDWQFSDADSGDTQSAYQVQVTRISDGLTYDSGKISGDASSLTAFQINSDMGNNFIWYDSTELGYAWRVKVWDSSDAGSGWANGPSFNTPKHRYPLIDFNWLPQVPSQDEDVLFADQSTVYDGKAIGTNWFWTFENGNPITSIEQNPMIQFTANGPKQVTLEVADSDEYVCPASKTIDVAVTLPDWREILPW